MTAQGLEECLGRGVELAGLARGPPTRLAPRGRRPATRLVAGGSSRRTGRSPFMTARPSSVSTTTGRSRPLKLTQPADTQRRSSASSQGCECSLRLPNVGTRVRPARSIRSSGSPWISLTTVCSPKRLWSRATPERALRTIRVTRSLSPASPSASRPRQTSHRPQPCEGLRLVAEVAKNRVVTAASPLDPANQLEEHSPLVLDHRRVGNGRPRSRARAGRRRSGQVTRRHQQQAERRRAVPARAPDLLVVRLDGAGRRQVDDRADVGPIDAHAEGVGRDHHLDPALGEGALRGVARPSIEPGVVGHAPPSRGRPASRSPPRPASGSARRRWRCLRSSPDRPGLRPGPRPPARRARDGPPPPPRGGTGWGARSPAPSGACPAAGPGAPGSRRARSGSRSRCTRARGRPAGRASTRPIARYSGRKSCPHSLMQWASSTATSGHVQLAEHRRGIRGRPGARAPRRRAQYAPRGQARHALPHLAGVESGGEIRRGDAARLERLDLVGHQRDQRRDHQRGAGQERGRELVAQALAAAGGRDQQQAPLGRAASPPPRAGPAGRPHSRAGRGRRGAGQSLRQTSRPVASLFIRSARLRLRLAKLESARLRLHLAKLERYFAYRFCHSARMRSRFFADQSKSFGKTTLLTSLGRPSGAANPGALTAAKNCEAILSDSSVMAQSRNCFAAAFLAPFLVSPLASIS